MGKLKEELSRKEPMTIVNPLISSALVQQSTTTPVSTSEERQVDLRMEQIIRATVVEGGLDRALLEMNHRHYRAQSDLELQVGQKLTLQVLQTHPRLEFMVLNDQLVGRLNQLLPLLARPYDWVQLVNNLQQQPQEQVTQANRQLYNQLQQLLQPSGQLPNGMGAEIVQLAGQLRQLALPFTEAIELFPFSLPATAAGNVVRKNPTGQSPTVIVNTLIRDLQQQLDQLPKGQTQTLPQGWVAATRNLLLPLQQHGYLLHQLPTLQLRELATQLGQIQQQPQLPAQFVGELGRLMAQLNIAQPATARQPLAVSTRPQATPRPGALSQPQVALLGGVAAAQQPGAVSKNPAVVMAPTATQATTIPPSATQLPVEPKEVSAGLDQLLAQVKQLQVEKGSFPPDLRGRLEALLDKLQQLPSAATTGKAVLPGLEALSSQLTQIVQQGVMRPEGGQLGVLSQLFGFHLETELLNGKKKDALASLKMSLLAMREELGKAGEEPLQRLELLQICKAKLAENQVQFLPLLFPELEEGYLFVEKQRKQDEPESEAPLQLSLSLRLSALGNMRIDMLYEEQGLHLRVACEDKEKMKYLQGCSTELQEAIETVPLQGVSFAADAQVPTPQLRERLLPEELGMLDARI